MVRNVNLKVNISVYENVTINEILYALEKNVY